MGIKGNPWLRFLKSIGIVIGYLVFLYAILILSFKYFESSTEKEISNPPPHFFRVFVSDNGNEKVISFDELDEYKKEHPNYSFLISEQNLQTINDKIEFVARKENPKSIPRIKILKDLGDKQIIEITHGGDGIFMFRYEATEKELRLLAYNSQGPGFIFGPCFVTGISGLIGIYLLRLIAWYLKRKRLKFEATGEK